MERIVKQLKQWLVISISDLFNIRKYIAQKYQTSTTEEKAAVLSDTVHRVLDKHLEGVDQEFRNALKYQILSSVISDEPEDITKYDVFKSIFELNATPSDQISIATEWLSKSTELNLPSNDILEFVIAYSHENNTARLLESDRLMDISTVSTAEMTSTPVYDERIRATNPRSTSTGRQARPTVLDKPESLLSSIASAIISARFALTCLVLFVITFTLASAYYYTESVRVSSESPIRIVKANSTHANPFTADYLYLMKTVKIVRSPSKIDAEISYEPFARNDDSYAYAPFDYFTLKNYLLNDRKAYIGRSEYLNKVISISRLNDIDPLLMLAIIGQEQGFVPADSPERDLIINNPYNVYHSWKAYNTNIGDSTQIAINTIKNSFDKKTLHNMDDIEWLNRSYAEDQNWHKGVREIYSYLTSICRKNF